MQSSGDKGGKKLANNHQEMINFNHLLDKFCVQMIMDISLVLKMNENLLGLQFSAIDELREISVHPRGR